MSNAYLNYFGFKKEPFSSDLSIKEILQTPELKSVADRFQYAVRLGAMSLVTGEVGSGKSTALRWAENQLHPSEYKVLWVIASSGSISEFYRQLLSELDIHTAAISKAVLIRQIRNQVISLTLERKKKPVIIIDEASLLRLEVFTELHTISQFEGDSKPWLPIILAGQKNLADKLEYQSSAPLASRVIARCHLEAVNLQTMTDYLRHHLQIAGVKQNLFEETSITAIHQGSGGLFRKANHLARGSLMTAAHEQCDTVSPEHVRTASTEIF